MVQGVHQCHWYQWYQWYQSLVPLVPLNGRLPLHHAYHCSRGARVECGGSGRLEPEFLGKGLTRRREPVTESVGHCRIGAAALQRTPVRLPRPAGCPAVTRHTSHVTRRTSHVARRTSHARTGGACPSAEGGRRLNVVSEQASSFLLVHTAASRAPPRPPARSPGRAPPRCSSSPLLAPGDDFNLGYKNQ